jgi:hypothetical protein
LDQTFFVRTVQLPVAEVKGHRPRLLDDVDLNVKRLAVSVKEDDVGFCELKLNRAIFLGFASKSFIKKNISKHFCIYKSENKNSYQNNLHI